MRIFLHKLESVQHKMFILNDNHLKVYKYEIMYIKCCLLLSSSLLFLVMKGGKNISLVRAEKKKAQMKLLNHIVIVLKRADCNNK